MMRGRCLVTSVEPATSPSGRRACCCSVAKTSRYSLLALEPRKFRADARPRDAANFLEGKPAGDGDGSGGGIE